MKNLRILLVFCLLIFGQNSFSAYRPNTCDFYLGNMVQKMQAIMSLDQQNLYDFYTIRGLNKTIFVKLAFAKNNYNIGNVSYSLDELVEFMINVVNQYEVKNSIKLNTEDNLGVVFNKYSFLFKKPECSKQDAVETQKHDKDAKHTAEELHPNKSVAYDEDVDSAAQSDISDSSDEECFVDVAPEQDKAELLKKYDEEVRQKVAEDIAEALKKVEESGNHGATLVTMDAEANPEVKQKVQVDILKRKNQMRKLQ